MRLSLLSFFFLLACGGDASKRDPGASDGSEGLTEDLASCETERDTAAADLTSCQTDLATCGSDLATADAALEASVAAEAATEAQRVACEADLAAAEQERDTCVADLATTTQDLATTAQDLATAAQDLATCEADRDQLQDDLDAVVLFDQDLIDYLGGSPELAWTGYSVDTWGENTDAYSLWFLPDGSVIWWTRRGPRSFGAGLVWRVDTWSVSGNTVTVHRGSGQMQFTYVAGNLIGPGYWRLLRGSAPTLGVYEASDAVATGTWGPCNASDTWANDCLVDDGSGGANPMSLTWSHTPPSYAKPVVPFVRRAWSPTGATNAMWRSSAGDLAIDHSSSGTQWVQMPMQYYASPATVTLDNAGADGDVIGDVVVFAQWEDYPL